MNHDPEKINFLELLTITGSALFIAVLGVSNLAGGQPTGLLFIGLAVVLLWSLLPLLHNGVRAPTQWERVRAWMNLRPILIGVLGFALVAAIATYGPRMMPILTQEMKIALTAAILIWVAALGYTIFRAQRRQEDDSTYKKRIGWQDPTE